MTEEELKIFTDKLVTDKIKEEAVFGIYQYGGGSDESYIKANKAGLQLLATELIYASLKCDAVIKDKEKNTIPLDYHAEWVEEESDTLLQYIEPIDGTRKKPIASTKKSDWKDEAFKYGCIIGFLIIGACIVTGFVTIVKTLL